MLFKRLERFELRSMAEVLPMGVARTRAERLTEAVKEFSALVKREKILIKWEQDAKRRNRIIKLLDWIDKVAVKFRLYKVSVWCWHKKRRLLGWNVIECTTLE